MKIQSKSYVIIVNFFLEFLTNKNVNLKRQDAKTTSLDAKPNSNNGSKEEDWSTAPAENILFPETYLSSIKRVLENASQNSSSLPVTSGAEPKKQEGNTVKSLKSKSQNEDEGEEGEAALKEKLEKHANETAGKQKEFTRN